MGFLKRSDEGARKALAAAKPLRGWLTGLAGRILLATFLIVLAVEALVLVPSTASHRVEWLRERATLSEQAIIGAVEPDPDWIVDASLTETLLNNAKVTSIELRKDGRLIALLEDLDNPALDTLRVFDMDEAGPAHVLSGFWHTVTVLLGFADEQVALVHSRQSDPSLTVRAVVSEEALRTELYRYIRNIIWLSLFIACGVGLGLFLAMMFLVVRPIRKLSGGMAFFQDNPEDGARVYAPSKRADEIGDAERALRLMEQEVAHALKQKGRLAALGSAVAKINHDLRNILTSAELLSGAIEDSEDPRVQRAAPRLSRTLNRAIGLAQNVLSYGRTDEAPPEIREVDLRRELDDAAEDALASVAHVDWINDVDDHVTVRVDPDYLHRILVNLLRNAGQAMEAQVSDARRGFIVADGAVRGGDYVLMIADSGPGIPEKAQERLFQAFSGSTSKGGSGLGLAIARELARAMGGDISLLKTGVEGTTFEVRLPQRELTPILAPRTAVQDARPGAGEAN